MILSDQEILIRKGSDIVIDPWPKKVNPNSVNLRLHPMLKCYSSVPLDMKQDIGLWNYPIPETGLLLHPGRLYLGRTVEYTETHNLVPLIEGRSSCARLGIRIHSTGGFGDNGFCGYWTLEIDVVEPVIIYPDVEICQIFYHTIQGSASKYEGKYQRNIDIQGCKLFEEF